MISYHNLIMIDIKKFCQCCTAIQCRLYTWTIHFVFNRKELNFIENGSYYTMGKDIYISVITLISGSISILGGLMLILSHAYIKRLHYIRRMLICLTIANIIQASGNLLGTVNYLTLKPLDVSKSDHFCVFQSFLTTFSSIASFNWSSMIAVHVFFMCCRKV